MHAMVSIKNKSLLYSTNPCTTCNVCSLLETVRPKRLCESLWSPRDILSLYMRGTCAIRIQGARSPTVLARACVVPNTNSPLYESRRGCSESKTLCSLFNTVQDMQRFKKIAYNEYTVNSIEMNDCHIRLASYSICIACNSIALLFFASVSYTQCWEGYKATVNLTDSS